MAILACCPHCTGCERRRIQLDSHIGQLCAHHRQRRLWELVWQLPLAGLIMAGGAAVVYTAKLVRLVRS